MKAVRVHEHGGPEVLRYEEVPDPRPQPDQAVVKVDVAGVNFIDIYFRTGLYKTDLPFTNGQEAAGVVSEVGADVSGLKPGDRVAYCGVPGGYAEYAAVPAQRLVKVPDGVDSPTAAALMVQGMTVHYLTHSTFALGSGHTALVHAAAGGVGLLLVQVGKMLGARIIATCSTEEKAALVRAAGADDVILYTQEDFLTEVKRLTGGKGVDVAYDAVGKATWQGSLDSLKPRGMMVFFGNASGPVPAIEPLTLTAKGSLFMTRPSLPHHVATREDLEKRSSDLFNWVRNGKLDVRIGETFPLSEAAAAQERLAARLTTGKLLLTP
ncbi:MAG TPA: quinone oxidoreductase [Bryobacterales bacterium]|nr:quinone oxidoreductase [Bryobacterales bacterium]